MNNFPIVVMLILVVYWLMRISHVLEGIACSAG